MNSRPLTAIILGLLLGLTSISSATDLRSIAENVAAHKQLTILWNAAKETRLLDDWNTVGPFTLFAPTDTAFRKLSERQIQLLVANPELLRKLISSHVIAGKALTAAELKNWHGKQLNGFRISTANTIQIGGAELILLDIKCSNGVIHCIDTVLMPEK
jgi:uncharacterized surface protein with fasciclin (FAS1) repeats